MIFNKYTFVVPLLCLSFHSFASLSVPSAKHKNEHHDTEETEGYIRDAALHQYKHWKGTHYRLGGTGHHGIDCSALTRRLVSSISGDVLPRTTSGQIKKGYSVTMEGLQAGDLVFFRTSRGQRHVGLYIGHHQFINASSSKGVVISSLDNVYWRSHYLTSRRLNSISAYYHKRSETLRHG